MLAVFVPMLPGISKEELTGTALSRERTKPKLNDQRGRHANCMPKSKKVHWLACWVMAFYVTACGHPGPYSPPPSQPQNHIKIESASFFPNGNYIAVGINDDFMGGIFIMDRKGTIKKWLLKDSPKIVYRSPAVSYDGSKIAFISNRHNPNGEIYIMDADGNSLKRLTHSDGFDRWPTFSQDGKRVYFIRSKITGTIHQWLGLACIKKIFIMLTSCGEARIGSPMVITIAWITSIFSPTMMMR